MQSQVKVLQEEGNALYASGRYDAARASYTRAIALVAQRDFHSAYHASKRDDTISWEARTTSDLLSNRAQTAIQERNFVAAFNDATEALKYHEKNEKALLRQLVALENLEKFQVALQVVDKVIETERDRPFQGFVQNCVAIRRRLLKNLLKDRKAAANEVKQVGMMVHDNQQLRINFGCLLPSQVPLDQLFDVKVNIGNEFGLFRRDYIKKGEHVHLQCSLRTNSDGRYKLVFQESLDSSGIGDTGSVDSKGRVTLNGRGKASFRVAVMAADMLHDPSTSNLLSLQIQVHEASTATWNLFSVVSLPFTVVGARGDVKEEGTGNLGVHCCRAVSIDGLQHDILLAESPGNLGIGGKLWDSSLVLTRYLAARRDLLVGKEVVELGSGLGLVGIFCSMLGARVTLTDMEEVIPLLDYNVRLNFTANGETNSSTRSSAKGGALVPIPPVAKAHMWGEPPRDLPTQPDVLVLSDVVYDPEGYAPLVSSMNALAASPDTLVLMAHRSRNPMEYRFFELLSQSFTCKQIDWLSTEKPVSKVSPAGRVPSAEQALQDVRIFEIRRLVVL